MRFSALIMSAVLVSAPLPAPQAVGEGASFELTRARSEAAVGPVDDGQGQWLWPTAQRKVLTPFLLRDNSYEAGSHRGIDVGVGSDAEIRAPADTRVSFAGRVAGRGVITLDAGDGWLISFEPVASTVSAGSVVARGDVVARVDGEHAGCAEQCVHIGTRWNGSYISPLTRFGFEYSVLLPYW